ncbi:MAG: Rieske (2Fe-2S) protein [Beijerinckiaceae bacterium]
MIAFDLSVPQPEEPDAGLLTRRAAIKAAAIGLAACPCSVMAVEAQEATSPDRMQRPTKGDKLVFAGGEHDGKGISADLLTEGGPQVMAWAADPTTGVLRDGSRLNQVLVLKLAKDSLGDDTKERSADGIVAYSALCSHALCAVSEWNKEAKVLHCPCHNSEYDPRDNAKVVGGPARRGLAALPVTVAEGLLIVAGPFIGKVGMQT